MDDRLSHLVKDGQLRCGEESLQSMEGRANLLVTDKEAEIQFPDITARVHKGVHMLLLEQVLKNPALGHQPEEVEIASKELHRHRW